MWYIGAKVEKHHGKYKREAVDGNDEREREKRERERDRGRGGELDGIIHSSLPTASTAHRALSENLTENGVVFVFVDVVNADVSVRWVS